MNEDKRRFLDSRNTPCPMNWVKVKLVLEEMAPGERLEVLLDNGESIRNVPRSASEEGHRILKVIPVDEYFQVLIEKG